MSNFLVSTLSLSGAPRGSISRVQQELAIAQKEVTTGRYADVGQTLGVTVGRTISMRAEVSNIENLTRTNMAVAQRFDIMQSVTGSIAESGEGLLSSLLSNGTYDAGAKVNKQVALANIGQLTGALNTSSGSRYLFSGAKTDTPAMNQGLSADYETSAAYAAVDAAWQAYVTTNAGGDPSQITATQLETFLDGDFETLFDDTNWKANWSDASDNQTTGRIGESDTLTTSVSANDESFRKVMKSYVMVANLDVDQMNEGARQFLTSRAVETLGEGLSDLTDLRSEIGIGQERIDRANEGLKGQKLVLDIAIGEEEEVDVYEASTRVTNLMNTLETSYALTARISRLSLLNYL